MSRENTRISGASHFGRVFAMAATPSCACATCDHDWEPAGTWGPYTVEECRRCGAGAVRDTAGWPPAYDAVTRALGRRHRSHPPASRSPEANDQ